MKNKRSQILVGLLAAIMVISTLLLLGCPSPATTTQSPAPPPTTSETTPESSPTTQAPVKSIELIFSSNTPESAPMSQYEQKTLDTITERTGGRVKFTSYWASTLIPDDESWNGMLGGVCDVLHWTASSDYQKLNWAMVSLPFIGWPSEAAGSELYTQLIDKFPALQEEFKGAEILTTKLMPPVQMHLVKKEVKAPSDLKGMKLACDGPMAQWVNLVGGAPANINVGDMYTSLNSGLIEGVINHFPVVSVFGTLPLYNYHTIFGEGGMQMMGFGMVMNPDSWAKLPPDIQKIIKDTCHEIWYEEGLQIEEGEIAKYTKEATDAGHTLTYLTPEQIKAFQDSCLPLNDTWIKEFEDQGKPARAIYEEAKRLIAAYGK